MAPLILIRPTSAARRPAGDPQANTAIRISATCRILPSIYLTLSEVPECAKRIRERLGEVAGSEAADGRLVGRSAGAWGAMPRSRMWAYGEESRRGSVATRFQIGSISVSHRFHIGCTFVRRPSRLSDRKSTRLN